MTNITFKKDDNTISISTINIDEGIYYANLNFTKEGKSGRALNQPLDKLCYKLFKEKFKIVDDMASEEKYEVWRQIMRLIK